MLQGFVFAIIFAIVGKEYNPDYDIVGGFFFAVLMIFNGMYIALSMTQREILKIVRLQEEMKRNDY